tara:strand:- start:1219 stop:1578 length:360 start_codon:yes stop_codon:yes gene_type:complete
MSGNHYSPHGNNDKEKGILISAIIPVYNSSSTFTQCLDGLFSSDYDNYEVLVVDDQSSDSSTEIARLYYENAHAREIAIITNGTLLNKISEIAPEIAKNCPQAKIMITLSYRWCWKGSR